MNIIGKGKVFYEDVHNMQNIGSPQKISSDFSRITAMYFNSSGIQTGWRV